jgi:hypothetical protein
MPGGTREADRAEPAGRAPESNSVRFSESQRDTDRLRSGDGGDSTERPESGDRAEPSERTVVGQPDRLAEHWEFQGYDTKDCDVYAEGTALKAFDLPFNKEEIQAKGMEEETYHPERGTNPEALGRVWEREGLEVDRHGPGGTPFEDGDHAFTTLQDRLSEEKAVVVAVDNGPLGGEGDGHAIWVTGMRTAPEGDVYVVTNDSGVPDGAGKEYTFESFNEAWRAYGYQMAATRDSMPDKDDK